MPAYVIMGSTGEYSDRVEWPVRAFTSEDRAKALVTMLDEWCLAESVAMGADKLLHYEEYVKLTCPHDPDFRCDYTGTRYYYYPVVLDEEQS